MQPLHRFDDHPLHLFGGPPGLPPQVNEALLFFEQTLLHVQPRKVYVGVRQTPPVLVWTDARWDPERADPGQRGGLGFAVFVPRQARAYSAAVEYKREHGMLSSGPDGEWFHGESTVCISFILGFVVQRQYIGQLEGLAAIAAYYSLPFLRGERVLHYIDNTSVLAALTKGYSAQVDSARIVHAFWALAVVAGIEPWFEYVPSEANIADWPSRGMSTYLVDTLRSSAVPLHVPPVDAWVSTEWALSHVLKMRDPARHARGGKRAQRAASPGEARFRAALKAAKLGAEQEAGSP